MKRIACIISILLFTLLSFAQTQQGKVKTRGRMVNGKHIVGKGLSGAVVGIKGRNKVVVQKANGSFSFVVPSSTFMIDSVKKKGYELVDADATTKAYHHSTDTLYLIMETPDQKMEDLLEAEEQLSKTLRAQLNKARLEIQRLRDEKKISEDEYNKRINKLMQDQQNNQKLIADMAKEYAQMDYDQMDELNQRISDAIINGRLTEADSLLRSKGDMKSRIAEIKKEQKIIQQREEEIVKEQAELAASKAGTQKKLEDIASDCYKFYERFKLENLHDSASYYIIQRAELDTTNAQWQFDAAYYLHKQNQFKKAESYYEKALDLSRRLSKDNPQTYEPDVATTLNNLANLYKNTQRFNESEKMYSEALEIRKRLAKSNPQAYEPDVATTLNNLAILYKNTQRFNESEKMYIEALEIYKRLAKSNPQAYEPDVAMTLNNLASLYSDTQRFNESEKMYSEALEIRKRLAKNNPQAYEPDVATTLNNLANLYSDTQRFNESEKMYIEALEIYKRLAKSNPQAYEPYVATTLNNLAILYKNTQRFNESEKMYSEALEIYKRLAKSNPQAYEPYVATTLNNLANLYKNTQRFNESEKMYIEALEIRKRLAKNNPQVYNSVLAGTLGSLAYCEIFLKNYYAAEQYAREGILTDHTLHFIYTNLAVALLFQGKYEEAEQIYQQYKVELKDSFLDDFNQFERAGVIPKEREEDVEKIKRILNE